MENELKNITDEVLRAADIVEIVSSFIDLKKKGKDWWALCPFHAESSSSFSVIPEKRAYYCFGCHKGGNAIDFWMEYHHVKFWDALKAVGNLCGVTVKGGKPPSNYKKYPEVKKIIEWEPEVHEDPARQWQDSASRFIMWAFNNMNNRPHAWDYLAGRGITEQTIVAYGLGWCEGENGKDLYRSRAKWGLAPEKNEDGKDKPLWLPKGLVIPFIEYPEKQGTDIVKIRIRREDLSFNPNMKYYFVPGGSNRTTVLEPERMAFVVVESDLDGILIAQEAGDMVGVVVLGSVHIKPDKYAHDLLKGAAHILNALDFDHAGASAWPWWEEHYRDCERWPVPEGKDPGEAWQKGVNIREWVRQGLPPGMRG